MLTKSSSSRGKHEQYSREGRFGSAFWISVSKRWFCLRKISMNAAQKCAFTIVVRANADSGGSMNAKSHITTFKWRHINAFPVHLSSNNSLEQCAVHAHEIVFFSREAWTVLPWRAFWIGVLNQRFKTLILPSQNKHERSLRLLVSGSSPGCHYSSCSQLEVVFDQLLPTLGGLLVKRWRIIKFSPSQPGVSLFLIVSLRLLLWVINPKWKYIMYVCIIYLDIRENVTLVVVILNYDCCIQRSSPSSYLQQKQKTSQHF